MKKVKNTNALVMLIVGLALVGGLAAVQSYGGKAGVVIENQTVNAGGVGARGGDEATMGSESLGAAIPSAAATRVTNFRVEGSNQSCEASSSSLCLAQLTEIKRFPFDTSSLVFTNPRTGTSTVSVLFLPRDPTKSSSSSYTMSCEASSTLSFRADMDMTKSLLANASDTLISQFQIPTSSAPIIDSRATSTVSRSVSPTQGLVCLLQSNLAARVCNPTSAAETCVQPTSTNRGIDWNVIATWSWITSSSQEF